ncbi:MAG: DNA repair protein RadA [Christensenellaceae bacterium]|jgi:DNA repair protein RadA/Sms|nr:DNA repair protein RadA [Christensenellaceae bacterium]
MPKKPKSVFVCSACGYESARWLGQCPGCSAWNTLEESAVIEEPKALAGRRAAIRQPSGVAPTLPEIDDAWEERARSGIGELDRVLGGGMVRGSLVLIGGDPGIGKSTLLLQAAALYAGQGGRVLYVSGEESARQIKMRAKRLGITGGNLHVLSETNIEEIEAQAQALSPDFLIVDSIQTVFVPGRPSAPGSVSQVREATNVLMRLAKQSGVSVFLVGHVTKEGALAGPRVLEHMVDAVLYFEGERHQEYRILRAAKNRFGSVNEIGVFRMLQSGMEEVENPSEFLLSGRLEGAAGSAVAVSMEGSRPVLVDIQALIAQTPFPAPRRQAYGFDASRVALLLAVLEKRAGFTLYNMDAYVNVAGGLELDEPAVDLPVAMAVASSVKNAPIPPSWAFIGEIGLSGEIRAVGQMERRLMECKRMGFAHVVIPEGNRRQVRAVEGIRIYGASSLAQALALLF